MALMERIATLLRANLNDLLARAENPETMLRQLVLDMRNQLLQAKTQVAMALADQHLLEKKAAEQGEAATSWRDRAGLALQQHDDALARAALERAVAADALHAAFLQQVEDQKLEAAALRGSYTRLQAKLAETEAQCELLLAQHRRARLAGRMHAAAVATPVTKTTTAGTVANGSVASSADLHSAVHAHEHWVETQAVEERFAAMERAQQVERLLAELKNKG